MTIQKIWKNSNVSTLLILPIFNDIVHNTKTKLYPYIEFPFILLCYEYGLINSYLLKEGSKDLNNLYVEFNSNVLEDHRLTNSSYHNIGDRIIDSKYIVDVQKKENIIYTLGIPEELNKDISLIFQGQYSKLSEEYKKLLKIKHKFIPKWTNDFGYYICKENISFSIVTKQKHLKEEMIKAIGQNFSNSQEFYPKFKIDQETLKM